MKNKLKNYFQTQFHFSSLEADKILYGLEALVSESVKLGVSQSLCKPSNWCKI